MNLDLHILQNFAPSNLNRDDTGSPKSCDFGGYRRARLSSQSIKRAIRGEFRDQDLVPEAQRAIQTKRVRDELVGVLASRDRPAEEASAVAEAGLGTIGIDLEANGKTQYLLYLGPAEISALAEFCETNWDALASLTKGGPAGREAKKAARQAGAEALSSSTVSALKARLDGGRASDLALFGRMLADLPEKNIDAASQVAHAISTHQVSFEFDYYTAVDDLQPEDTAGADMIGTVEFNSACFYRYANVDIGQLTENLGGDTDLVRATVRAFLYASRDAVPTGKQNSFAARNMPSLAFAVVRDAGFWSLANAFVKPVKPRGEQDLVQLSANALATYWGDLAAMYGAPAGTFVVAALPSLHVPAPLDAVRVDGYEAMVQRVMSAIEG